MWPKERKKILVVDDEEGIRQILVRFLVREGHDVHEASGVEDAIPIFESGMPFSALLCDINLGGSSGWSVVTAVRALQPSLPVLMLTGLLDKTPCPTTIPYTLLPKPFTQDELKAALRRLW